MKSVGHLLQWLGSLLVAGAITYGVYTYVSMMGEDRLHALLAVIDLNLSQQSDWKEARFVVLRDGEHGLHLSTLNPFGKPFHESEDDEDPLPLFFGGVMELQLLRPDGIVLFSGRFDSTDIRHAWPRNLEWTELGRIDLAAPSGGEWRLRTRVVEPDSRFDRTTSQVLIMPPQVVDIGWFLFGKTIELVVSGILALFGLTLLLAGVLLKRRARRGTSTTGKI